MSGLVLAGGLLLTYVQGGDVISFSGDAVVAVWWTDANLTPEAYQHLAHTAIHCAFIVQNTLSNRHYQIANTLDDISLSLRVAIGAGDLYGVHVGGVHNRWLFTVSFDSHQNCGRISGIYQ